MGSLRLWIIPFIVNPEPLSLLTGTLRCNWSDFREAITEYTPPETSTWMKACAAVTQSKLALLTTWQGSKWKMNCWGQWMTTLIRKLADQEFDRVLSEKNLFSLSLKLAPFTLTTIHIRGSGRPLWCQQMSERDLWQSLANMPAPLLLQVPCINLDTI